MFVLAENLLDRYPPEVVDAWLFLGAVVVVLVFLVAIAIAGWGLVGTVRGALKTFKQSLPSVTALVDEPSDPIVMMLAYSFKALGIKADAATIADNAPVLLRKFADFLEEAEGIFEKVEPGVKVIAPPAETIKPS